MLPFYYLPISPGRRHPYYDGEIALALPAFVGSPRRPISRFLAIFFRRALSLRSLWRKKQFKKYRFRDFHQQLLRAIPDKLRERGPSAAVQQLRVSAGAGRVRARKDPVDVHRVPGQQGLHRAHRPQAERYHSYVGRAGAWVLFPVVRSWRFDEVRSQLACVLLMSSGLFSAWVPPCGFSAASRKKMKRA